MAIWIDSEEAEKSFLKHIRLPPLKLFLMANRSEFRDVGSISWW